MQHIEPLIAPHHLISQLSADATISQHVTDSKKAIKAIVNGEDQRLLVIVGPCSIHDPKATLEYATRLCQLKAQLKEQLLIVMRVYFEKPRTHIGWKGLINDPCLDNSYQINQGLHTARQLLLDINQMGLAIASEFIDTITPQYIADLISWAAIGARTVESPIHRALASGLAMPVGFKNATTGNVEVAINAISAAQCPQNYLSVNDQGCGAIIHTQGNPDGHLILRGGSNGPNYSAEHIQMATQILLKKQLPARLMIDCSHGNSLKNYQQQKVVVKSVAEQLQRPNSAIMGVMIESNLVEGHQSLTEAGSLRYGQSITDQCIGWQETEQLLCHLAACYFQTESLV